MLDDTYYDDFKKVSYERMFKTKISYDDYNSMIDVLRTEPNFFKEKIELI